MEFVLTDLEHINVARGFVVVIDVLRAFSTSCYVFGNGAKTIIPVATTEEAFSLKKEFPTAILLGERKGLPIPGFDYTNSPALVRNVDFTGKTVIMTTTAGTKGIVCTRGRETVTGSFVNCTAIARHIKQRHPSTVSFVCTDSRYFDNEDYLCAAYIRSLVENSPLEFRRIQRYIARHPSSEGFLKKPMTEYAGTDYRLCMKLDSFDFVVSAHKHYGQWYLRKAADA